MFLVTSLLISLLIPFVASLKGATKVPSYHPDNLVSTHSDRPVSIFPLFQVVEDLSTPSKTFLEKKERDFQEHGYQSKSGLVLQQQQQPFVYDESPLFSSSVQRIPEIGAWRALLDAKINSSPPSLSEYFSGQNILSDEHEERVTKLWSLVRNRGSIRHLDLRDNLRLMDALKICYISLWGRKTARSWEDASIHARGIASILGEIKAPVDVVLSGLLSEVVAVLQAANDTTNMLELEKKFGTEVIRLAREYNMLPKFMAKTAEYTFQQSQAQLEMLISSMENFYCLHIRLADRIHTMRELKNLPLDNHERRKIAEEARYVYAPLAHKINIMSVKDELEDLSLKYIEPDMFLQCRNTQTAANKAYQEAYEKIRQIVEEDTELSKYKDRIKITYRIKGKYQLYQKMLRKGLSSPKQVRDALGIRLVVNPLRLKSEDDETYRARCLALCYYLMHRIRNMPDWEGDDAWLKDYILSPKENGYQSIHQYIKRKGIMDNTMIEVQVRTKEMDLQAEIGAAAHWSYKDQIFRPEIATSKLYQSTWRSPAQLAATNTMDVIRLAQQYLHHQRVFVFLEDKSQVLNLKRSSTALDAAFMLHSDIGLTAETIYVDGVAVAKQTVLKDGQVISVKTSSQLSVAAQVEALTCVRTAHAKQVIRRHLRDHHSDAVLCLGIVQLLMFFTFNEDVIRQRLSVSHNPDRKLDIWLLQKWVKIRLGKNMDHFLQELALIHSKDTFRNIMAGVVDVKAQQLRATTALDIGLIWARMQGEDMSSNGYSGWSDEVTREHFLIPLLDELLPALGYANIRDMWCTLIGKASLQKTTGRDNHHNNSVQQSSGKDVLPIAPPPDEDHNGDDNAHKKSDAKRYPKTMMDEETKLFFPLNLKPSTHTYHWRQHHQQRHRQKASRSLSPAGKPLKTVAIANTNSGDDDSVQVTHDRVNDSHVDVVEENNPVLFPILHSHTAHSSNSVNAKNVSHMANMAEIPTMEEVASLALRWQRMGKASYAAKLLERHLSLRSS